MDSFQIFFFAAVTTTAKVMANIVMKSIDAWKTWTWILREGSVIGEAEKVAKVSTNAKTIESIVRLLSGLILSRPFSFLLARLQQTPS